MNIRPYDPDRDREAIHRIWREVGWSDGSAEQEAALEAMLRAGPGLVAELEGAAECVVLTAPATVRYLTEDLPTSAITNVVTSHVGKKRGLASRTTALSLARDAAAGALVAALGVFEQGYYDRLGFGTGSYDHWLTFDPAQLTVSARHRVPHRLTRDDWQAVHAARLVRPRQHGALNILPPQVTEAEMWATRNQTGLGYYDGPDGTLSHYIWCGASAMEHGPYYVRWLVYHTREQFIELMALIKSLGDQVRLVGLVEPPGVQLQALLHKPFKQQQITDKSPYASVHRARAWWQARICDLAGCLARTHLPAGPVRFNLRLSDPIERYLGPEAPWHGVAGDHVVTLGPSSGAEAGADPALPTLTASVNAFTRLWLGVGPATGLAMTDDLSAPEELLQQLDAVLCLPKPQPGWEF